MLECQHITGEKSLASSFFSELNQIIIRAIFNFSCSHPGDCSSQPRLCRNCVDRCLCSLRNINSVAKISATVSILAIGDHYYDASAGSRPQLFVAELPDSIIRRRLTSQLLHAKHCPVEQV